jgi:Na+/proline symporter
MNPVDYGIILFYFAVVIGLGFWYQKRASKSLSAYFLGGKSIHWLALAMSGSVSNFDITGTMWIISILYVLGMKSMWHHWMMMVLGAGMAVPNVLRWYWWRMNGWGYALGILGGMLLSLLTLFLDDVPVYYVFPAICLASLAVSIIASLVTQPVDRNILIGFYKSVRPFGLWKPVAVLDENRESRNRLPDSAQRSSCHARDCRSVSVPDVPRGPLVPPFDVVAGAGDRGHRGIEIHLVQVSARPRQRCRLTAGNY